MAKDNNAPQSNSQPRVVQTSESCMAEGCKKKITRMHFCDEHFEWYKEGLINKRGERPSDFDKKHQHWLRKKAAA